MVFDVTSPAITVYRLSAKWARTTLRNGQADLLMKGMKGCWPSRDCSIQIRDLAISLHHAVAPGETLNGVRTKTLLGRIAKRVHLDKYQSAGPRLFYIALAGNTLIQRCMQSIDNTNIQDQRAMPHIIFIEFRPDNCALPPPQNSNTSWPSIRRRGATVMQGISTAIMGTRRAPRHH